MSPTLTDANMAASDPGDGLAVLEQRGKTQRLSAFRSRCLPS